MKIIKMCVARSYSNENYYCVFDEIPELTYERIGSDYVGSACDEEGNIIFSRHLGYEYLYYRPAFGGRELTLKMKDGTEQKIKDHWFDWGHYKPHGEFIDIGAKTIEELQRCYVYCGMNINKSTFQKMLDDYYTREKEYSYDEIEKWVNMQYKWFPVIIDGKQYPLMVNEKGRFVKRETKERAYDVRRNIHKCFKTSKKSFRQCFFIYEYKENDRLIKVQRNMKDVLKESLPHLSMNRINELVNF